MTKKARASRVIEGRSIPAWKQRPTAGHQETIGEGDSTNSSNSSGAGGSQPALVRLSFESPLAVGREGRARLETEIQWWVTAVVRERQPTHSCGKLTWTDPFFRQPVGEGYLLNSIFLGLCSGVWVCRCV